MADSSLSWNLNKYRQLQLPHADYLDDGHDHVVLAICLQGNYLVSASVDRTIRIWSLKTQQLLQPALEGHTGSVRAVQFDAAANENVLISGDSEGDVIVWRFSLGEPIKIIVKAHEGGACAGGLCSLHFDRKYLVTGGRQGEIKLWNRHTLRAHSADIPDFVARSAKNGRFPTYSRLATFNGHEKAVLALQLKDDVLVSGSGDSKIHIRSLQTGAVMQVIGIHERGVACLQYNGRFIVSGSSDDTIKIYDLDRNVEVARLEGHTNLIHSVQATFNADAEVDTIISGSYDGSIRVWKHLSGSTEWRTKCQLEISGFMWEEDMYNDHEFGNRINTIALDHQRLVCCGQGPMIRIWDFTLPRE